MCLHSHPGKTEEHWALQGAVSQKAKYTCPSSSTSLAQAAMHAFPSQDCLGLHGLNNIQGKGTVTKNTQPSPNCCMARSALQGNSNVMWTRRFWFFTRLSAWREIPELEASEIIATS